MCRGRLGRFIGVYACVNASVALGVFECVHACMGFVCVFYVDIFHVSYCLICITCSCLFDT